MIAYKMPITFTTPYQNPYFFTGRRVDILDNGSLKIQYNRNRYYDYYTGRWTTHDPLGIDPAGSTVKVVGVVGQYSEALSLYQYALSNPIIYWDARGFGCKFNSYATIMWLATPLDKTPSDILTSKELVDKLWLATMIVGTVGKGGPFGLAYATATEGGSWAFAHGFIAADMRFCGSHLYTYVCEWNCMTVTKGIIKKKKVKEPVFQGCYWWQCKKKKSCWPPSAPCDCDTYFYPIKAADRSKCEHNLWDWYNTSIIPRKLHTFIASDFADIKDEQKSGL